IRLSGDAALGSAGLKSKTTPHDKKEADDSVDPSTAQGAAEPRLHAPASTEQIPSDGAPQGDQATSSVAQGNETGEIELKLLVDADRLADFNNAPVFATNARNKGTRKHLKATYYDTRERALWLNRLSFRVRQSGTRFVQTVKAELGDDPLRR